jgi:hypothetical protein
MTGTDSATIPNEASQGRRLFLANMAALWRADSLLAQQIDDLPDSLLDGLVPSKAGPPTLAAPAADGRTIWLHSRYDPRKQAEQFAQQTIDLEKPSIVLTGVGLGYLAEAIWQHTKGRCVLIVLEPDLAMIFRALHCADLSKAIRDNRLMFLTSEEPDHLHDHLEPQNLLLIAGTQIVIFEPGMHLAGDFHKRMSQRITDYVSYVNMSVRTIFANARITAQNIANNLPAYLATPPIDILKDRFAGKPGILVAAGPSLRKHLDLLADLQDRAVTCCVQTVFKTLLARGIVPHFVTSLDYSEISKRFFEGTDDFRGVHLVAEPKANHHTVDAYGGPVSLLDSGFARMCLGEDLAARQGLQAGATVAHLAFYLLEHLGCDPIILLGQDLAFSEGLYYAPGVATHEVWNAELNRYNSLEMMEWLRVARQRPILRRATDVHGRAVYTDDTMLTYLQQFERDFAACPATVIDATEGGLPKRATQPMPLRQAAERFCREPLPAEAFSYRQDVKWYDGSRLPEGRKRIVERMEQLDRCVQMYRQTGRDLEELDKLLDRSVAEFNRTIAKADRARILAHKDKIIMQMVSELAQLAEYRRMTADRLLEGEDLPEVERARRQLQRDLAYNQGLIEAADKLREIFEGALERFDIAISRDQAEASR